MHADAACSSRAVPTEMCNLRWKAGPSLTLKTTDLSLVKSQKYKRKRWEHLVSIICLGEINLQPVGVLE